MELKDEAMARLFELVASTLKVSLEKVNLDSGPSTLDGWDSFHHVHLMVAVEERYKIELDGDEIANMISVGDIARVLKERGVLAA